MYKIKPNVKIHNNNDPPIYQKMEASKKVVCFMLDEEKRCYIATDI